MHSKYSRSRLGAQFNTIVWCQCNTHHLTNLVLSNTLLRAWHTSAFAA